MEVVLAAQLMKDRLLERADVNVVVVDWGRGSGPPYNQAVANIRMVGYTTARLLYRMKVREHLASCNSSKCSSSVDP